MGERKGGWGIGGSSTKLEGGISLRARHFAEIYDGNGYAAALKAGFSKKNAKNRASQLLDDERVQAIIRSRETARRRGDIAKRDERQAFWTAVMRDETRDMKDRQKASELLGRSEGDFFDNLNGSLDVPKLPDGLTLEVLEALARGEPLPKPPPSAGGDAPD